MEWSADCIHGVLVECCETRQNYEDEQLQSERLSSRTLQGFLAGSDIRRVHTQPTTQCQVDRDSCLQRQNINKAQPVTVLQTDKPEDQQVLSTPRCRR